MMSHLIDSFYLEEDLLLPMLVPPAGMEGDGTIPPAILERLVSAARFADPNNNTDWGSHFNRLKSFAHHWEFYIRGDITQDELVARQAGWAAVQEHQDKLDLASLEQNIALEESKIRDYEQRTSTITETRNQVGKYRNDLQELQVQLDAATISASKNASDIASMEKHFSSVTASIEAFTKDRKSLEDTIERQECDRDQVMTFQTQIETVKENLREIKTERVKKQKLLKELNGDLKKSLADVKEKNTCIENVLRTSILPKMKAEDEAKHKLWRTSFASPKVDEAKVYDMIKKQLPHPIDEAKAVTALVSLPVERFMSELVDKLSSEQEFMSNLEDDLKDLILVDKRLSDANTQLRQKLSAFKDDHEITKSTFDNLRRELQNDIRKLQASIQSNTFKLDRTDTGLANEMKELDEAIKNIINQSQALANSHQCDMKKYSDLLKLMEYKLERRSCRASQMWTQSNQALKTLLFTPIQEGLCDESSRVAQEVFLQVRKEASKTLISLGNQLNY
eukprot:GHVH01017478.1.p1 GENE.GHVH01017478.1~~GHVH01017478.1.p1  ORF type:complete len:508 (+),score=88.59 GHVH01017478.1:420-1943(+)